MWNNQGWDFTEICVRIFSLFFCYSHEQHCYTVSFPFFVHETQRISELKWHCWMWRCRLLSTTVVQDASGQAIGFLLGSLGVTVALTSDACYKGLPKTPTGDVATFRGNIDPSLVSSNSVLQCWWMAVLCVMTILSCYLVPFLQLYNGTDPFPDQIA